jgi:hypothetical protein
MAESSEASRNPEPGLPMYALVTLLLTAFGAGLALAVRSGSGVSAAPRELIAPMLALVTLTALVWLLMVVARNAAILRGLVSVRYYVDYASHTPREWIERPARAFNNLMQVPTLFYVVCVLGIVTGVADRAQITLAWCYVAARAVHAIIYIGWNFVPFRFGCWAASCIALGVIWFRFATLSGSL